jgi:hypothetical protein
VIILTPDALSRPQWHGIIREISMVGPGNQRTKLPHLGFLGAGFATLIFCACIPSYPPCDCGNTKGDDESGGDGPGEFPDFEFLDRSQACADIPLPIEGAECGWPEGPYGFEDGDVMENLELFDCAGNPVQLAQYIPQVGLPDVETRGVVFGVGAAWCQPCAEEAQEWAGSIVDVYAPQGIQFLQALDEGAVGAATAQICTGWSSANAMDKFPILWTPEMQSLQQKISGGTIQPIPYTLIFDANANVVLRYTGGILDPDQLTAQLDLLLNNPYGN